MNESTATDAVAVAASASIPAPVLTPVSADQPAVATSAYGNGPAPVAAPAHETPPTPMATWAPANRAGRKTAWTPIHSLIIPAIVAGIVLLGLWPRLTNAAHVSSAYSLFAWLGTMLLLALGMFAVGHGITGLWRGALIDERNKLSLSRLQVVLWTILVLSAFLTVALANISANAPSPLAIEVPQQLWLAMGISVTAMIGSPLILGLKTGQPTNKTALETTRQQLVDQHRLPPSEVVAQGQVLVNRDPSSASWSDIFCGEETGNGAHLDIAKIQMFYFTVILLVAYGVATANLLVIPARPIASLPALDSSMIALLAISSSAYLTTKSIPHTAPASDASAANT